MALRAVLWDEFFPMCAVTSPGKALCILMAPIYKKEVGRKNGIGHT